MRVPIDITELAVAEHLARDPRTGQPIPDSAIDGLAVSAKHVREAAEALKALHDAPGPGKSADARFLDLRRQAVKVAEAQAYRLDAAREKAQAEADAVRKAIHGPAPIDPVLAGEVRNALKTMKPEDARALIQEAIKDGDDLTVSAVLSVPGYLAGQSPDMQQGLRDAWQRQRFPVERDRLQRLTKALEAQERVARSFMGMVRELTTGTAAQLAQAAENAAAANEAIRKHQGAAA